ncbi:MAG: tRNA (guanosine(37)-N1)-methyltransferase TrmD [Kosmotoga sp.]|nr:MAG: tRNA (guanosine(37)-N1)-methyltransferase TrmD [Kosmotoga sp.]
MSIRILTIFPDMFSSLLEWGVISRSVENGILEILPLDLRDFTDDKHRTTDDYPYGGGSGLVMKAPPFFRAYESITKQGIKPHVVFTTPRGTLFDNDKAKELAEKDNLLFLCGRYEGVDERVMTIVDEELSIGDFVLSGGELATMVMIDALSRFIPGVVGDIQSVKKDSFYNEVLDHSHYTRPRETNNLKVPEVMLSGNHKKIELCRRKESLLKTIMRRPDLFMKHELDEVDKKALIEIIKENVKDV